jgi:hypothetical protein
MNQNSSAPTNAQSTSVVETNAIPLEQLTEVSTSSASVKEMTEEERIKEIQASSQARYV